MVLFRLYRFSGERGILQSVSHLRATSEAIITLGEYAAGKRAWINHLKIRYQSAEDAARAWGISINPAYGVVWEYLARLDTWFRPADVLSELPLAGAANKRCY